MDTDVHEVKRAAATFSDDDNAKMAADNLATLLGRVSEASSHEIENLIGEFRGIREKLKTDCDHLQSDIAEYAKLSRGAMQLSGIISDGVKELPKAPRIIQ
jgi:hypothetical protein